MQQLPVLETPRGDSGVIVMTWGHAVISVFGDRPTVEDLDIVARVQREATNAHCWIALLTMFRTPEAMGMESAVRARARELAVDADMVSLGAATVIGTTGLRATLSRSLHTCVAMVSPTHTPTRTFSRLDPACAWLLSRPGTHATLRGVPDAMAEDIVQLCGWSDDVTKAA